MQSIVLEIPRSCNKIVTNRVSFMELSRLRASARTPDEGRTQG